MGKEKVVANGLLSYSEYFSVYDKELGLAIKECENYWNHSNQCK